MHYLKIYKMEYRNIKGTRLEISKEGKYREFKKLNGLGQVMLVEVTPDRDVEADIAKAFPAPKPKRTKKNTKKED